MSLGSILFFASIVLFAVISIYFFTIVFKISKTHKESTLEIFESERLKPLLSGIADNKDNMELISVSESRIFAMVEDNDKEMFDYLINESECRGFSEKEREAIGRYLYEMLDKEKYQLVHNKAEQCLRIFRRTKQKKPWE